MHNGTILKYYNYYNNGGEVMTILITGRYERNVYLSKI